MAKLLHMEFKWIRNDMSVCWSFDHETEHACLGKPSEELWWNWEAQCTAEHYHSWKNANAVPMSDHSWQLIRLIDSDASWRQGEVSFAVGKKSVTNRGLVDCQYFHHQVYDINTKNTPATSAGKASCNHPPMVPNGESARPMGSIRHSMA